MNPNLDRKRYRWNLIQKIEPNPKNGDQNFTYHPG